MSRKILITSGKGGVGKTTICANLGISLANAGLKVVMIDLDIGLNNLDVVMGIENKVIYDIVDVIENKCRIKQALIQDELQPTLYILPSAHIYAKNKINSQNIKVLVNKLAETFDYILIDCPAGIDIGFHRAALSADEAIVVTTPHVTAIRDADKVVSVLSNYNMLSTSFIVNKIRGDLVLSGEMIDVKTIEKLMGINLLGVVPEDDNISTRYSLASISKLKESSYLPFSMLASNLHNNKSEIYDYESKYKGFFGNIRRSLKRRF